MAADAQNTATDQPVRAPRGLVLSCKGWQQEAVLRMLLNSLDPEVAERPQDLVICGAAGKATANWKSFRSIVASLRQLAGDESLIVESGQPAGVFRTNRLSPRVLLTRAAGNEVCGDWLYAGTQSALPVLYELYAAAARRHFDGTLAGKLVIGGGLGGAGGAQPLAAMLNGAAFLGIDADAERIKRRVKTGYCEVMVNHLDEALRILKNAVRQRAAVSAGLIGNCADVFPELARHGVVPDLLTDYTPAEAPFNGYVPLGFTPDSAADARHADADAFRQRVLESAGIHLRGMRELERLGARVITWRDDIALRINMAEGRDVAVAAGQPSAGDTHSFLNSRDYLRPLADEGRRLITCLALSGEPGDIARADRLALEAFSGDERVTRWIALASKYVRFQGLPARVAWLRDRELGTFGLALNDLVARGEIKGPILLGCRFALPESSRDAPIRDGKALLEDMSSTESGACWVWFGGGAGPGELRQVTAQAFVADGTGDAGERIARWLTNGADPKTA